MHSFGHLHLQRGDEWLSTFDHDEALYWLLLAISYSKLTLTT